MIHDSNNDSKNSYELEMQQAFERTLLAYFQPFQKSIDALKESVDSLAGLSASVKTLSGKIEKDEALNHETRIKALESYVKNRVDTEAINKKDIRNLRNSVIGALAIALILWAAPIAVKSTMSELSPTSNPQLTP